jgi:HAD superfamily hydrolase (TIGR01493 family)
MMRGVLFDVDGTLVDTNYLHAVSWGEALRQNGHIVATKRVHRAIGMATTELLDHLLGVARDKDQDDVIAAARLTLYRQHWGRLTRLPGAAELLRGCAHNGLRVVLASSASAEELAVLRRVIDADDAIDAATGSADAEAGKPNPDILQVALDKAGLRPEEALLVGDSTWDGQAAARAGLAFVALTCGGTSAAELTEAGAVEIWADPLELNANLDRSRLATAPAQAN